MITKFQGFASEGLEDAIPVLTLIPILAGIDIVRTVLKSVVDQAG